MKWEKLFTKILEGDSKRLLPYNEIAQEIETLGKIGAATVGLFYVVGLIIFGAYYSQLHIRSIELFKVRYLFVGFYYAVFLFMHLFLQHRYLKRWWLKVIYLAVLLFLLILLDDVYNTYFNCLVSMRMTGESFLRFEPQHMQLILLNLICQTNLHR
jgi:hypothetical protein